MSLKKIAATAVATVAVGLGALMGTAAPASADAQSYVNALVNGGFGNYSAADALAVGAIACQTPGSAQDKTAAVYANTVGSIDWAEAQYITASALIHLC